MLKKINIGLVALILGFGLTITTSAFKNAGPKKADVQWNFRGNTIPEVNDVTKYSTTLPTPTSCGSATDLPCFIMAPEGVDTPSELHDYLVATYGNSASAINAAIQDRREAL
ncbi:MAG: hypothetical protein EOO88_46695 [Pedobacter sp.]|nr:MAG: hypothetical protein EOO88_46695 [Pedobacter sp.]